MGVKENRFITNKEKYLGGESSAGHRNGRGGPAINNQEAWEND